MRNANEAANATVIRTRVELLMNFYQVVVRSQEEQLRVAMLEYRQSLKLDRAA